MDALQSFVYLNESVPLWLSKLDDLTVSVAEHNARFLEMAHLGSKLLKKKNPSIESLREGPVHHAAVEGESAVKTTDIYVPPNPSYQYFSHTARTRNAVKNIPLVRKRKGSNASLTSEHPQYRTKSMVVVYYDSAVQDAFDSLFRSVASARSNLRKGKTAASFKASMASLDMGETLYSDTQGLSKLNPKSTITSLGSRTLSPDFGTDDKLSSFEDADKDLEATQNLCEVAAHQFLRDGDCRLEIDGMRKKIESCQAMAKREVERLKEEEEEEEQEQEEKEASSLLVRGEQLPVMNYVEAEGNPPRPLKEFSFTGMIEIDDQPGEETVQIDFSAFRTRARRV